jgi:diguanylate cyclase (GGDEF)-like protein
MTLVQNNINWSNLEPYAQLIGALLPRAAGVSVFDSSGEVCWTSDPSVNPELPQLVTLSVAASAAQSEEPGERVLLPGDGPVYLFWLRDDNQELICILAISWRSGDFEQRTFAFVHSLVKPAIEVLRRELDSRVQLLRMNNTMSERDRDLDALLLAGGEAEKREASGDEIKNLLQTATAHLRCEFSALVVPERSLVVIAKAEGHNVDTSVLAKVHRHLLSLAQVRTEPVVLNAANSLPGVTLTYRVLSSPVRNPSGRAGGVLALFRALDAPEFRERDAQMADLLARRAATLIESSYDSLSGLLTRGAFEQRARALMGERGGERKTTWSGLYIDSDRLHVINDNYGMYVGDKLIAKFGELIRSRLVPGALAARISGDRFAILLPTGPEEAVAFAEALRQGVAAVNASHLGAGDDSSFSASVSIGVSAIVDPRVEFAHAFAVAETACKAAKDRGRNRVELYQASDVSIMQRHEDLNMAPSLRAAISENRMRLDSQLIVPLPGSRHAVPHFELLLRMIDDKGETVGPDRFMSSAVRYQLMPTVDRWVLNEAIRQLKPHAAIMADQPVVFTINISGQSLGEPGFGDFVCDLLASSGLNPKVFCFELTESAAIANLGTAEVLMRRLRALGCTIALDDFGTGLSSLAYLRALPVDILKIDGSFVRDILKDPRAESMVQAIAQLARSMKMITVAEYVESDEIRLRVATLGVDYGQGFAIARPVPMTDTVAELPVYATRVAYGRELDGLLRDSETFDALDSTDVAELGGDMRGSSLNSSRKGSRDAAAARDESADDTNHDPAAYEVNEGPDPSARELGPDDNTQRRLEKVLEESFMERRANQQRRSGNT